MKRLLALLLLLCLLAGCGSVSENPTQTPAESPDVPVQSEPETPVEPEKPAPTLMNGRELEDPEGGLWYLPNEAIEGSCYQDLYLFGDNLLVTGLRYNGNPYGSDAGETGGSATSLRLAVLSLETGLPLYETTLNGVDSPQVQICGNQVSVCDWSRGNVYLLDDHLRQTAGCRITNGWGSFYLSSDGETAYLFTDDDGIVAVDLATDQRTVFLENARSLYTSGCCGSNVTINYVDDETQFSVCAFFSLETGEITPLPVPGDYYSVERSGDAWLAGVLYSSDAYLLGGDGDPGVVTLENCAPELLTGPARLLIPHLTDEGDRELALYETDGSFCTACRQPDAWNSYNSTLVWSERWGGYLFTVTDYNGSVRLLFWDTSVPSEGENLVLTPMSALTAETGGTAVAQELYDRAAALSEQYGVHIKIADQCATEYNSYTVELDLDYWRISSGLDALENAMADYPDGFMEQLLYDTYREIEINLTGPLTPVGVPEDANGFTSFAAFVEQQTGKHVMVMDLNQMGNLEENFYHEMSHIIDGKLGFDSLYRDGALYSEDGWVALNPPDFFYCYDYYNIPDDIYADGYNSYFIDTYSRTFPTEDRARVMEYAMIGYDWMFSEDGSAPLREKLRYYADCIRDCFDTTGWPAVTRWEEPLQNSTTGGA